jgi:hypothetical protein
MFNVQLSTLNGGFIEHGVFLKNFLLAKSIANHYFYANLNAKNEPHEKSNVRIVGVNRYPNIFLPAK